MKKKTLANLIMVLMIAGILVTGILVATKLTSQEESFFGSEYKITEIPDHRLVSDENTGNLCTIAIRCDTILSNADKLAVSAQMADRGLMTRNEIREIWNLPPVDGGDEMLVRAEYINTSERTEE